MDDVAAEEGGFFAGIFQHAAAANRGQSVSLQASLTTLLSAQSFVHYMNNSLSTISHRQLHSQ